MENYEPSYQVTDKILMDIASISEKVGHITEQKRLETKKRRGRGKAIGSAFLWLYGEYKTLPVSEMCGRTAEHFALGEENQTQEEKNALEACQELLDWMQRSKVHPLIAASIFYYEFLSLDTCADENNDLALMWYGSLLADWRSIFQYITIEEQIQEYQDSHDRVLASCRESGNCNEFIEFMLWLVELLLDKVKIQVRMAEEYRPDRIEEMMNRIEKMLNRMEDDVEYSAQQLQDMFHIKARATITQQYINPALARGYIKMTRPDVTTSSRQKYVKACSNIERDKINCSYSKLDTLIFVDNLNYAKYQKRKTRF